MCVNVCIDIARNKNAGVRSRSAAAQDNILVIDGAQRLCDQCPKTEMCLEDNGGARVGRGLDAVRRDIRIESPVRLFFFQMAHRHVDRHVCRHACRHVNDHMLCLHVHRHVHMHVIRNASSTPSAEYIPISVASPSQWLVPPACRTQEHMAAQRDSRWLPDRDVLEAHGGCHRPGGPRGPRRLPQTWRS